MRGKRVPVEQRDFKVFSARMDSTLLKVFFITLIASVVYCSSIAAETKRVAQPQRSTLVVLIGGMDSDPTAEQIAGKAPRTAGNSGLYRLRSDLQHPQIVTEYFNWNGTRAGQIHSQPAPQSAVIAETIRQMSDNIPPRLEGDQRTASLAALRALIDNPRARIAHLRP